MREVYVRPAKEFRLSEGALLRLLKPLYGLADSGDHWSVAMARHLHQHLKMHPTSLDMSLYVRYMHGRLAGLTGSYVDDSLHAGRKEFLSETDKSLQKFRSRKREINAFEFAGVQIETVADGFRLHQAEYARKMPLLPTDCGFSLFRSVRRMLLWLVHIRPDVACSVNKAAHVTEQTFGAKAVADLNSTIRHVKKSLNRGPLQRKLDRDSLHLHIYTDSSFANNDNLSTKLGYLVLLCDGQNSCHILHYSSHKSRRTVRSVMGGETYSFADGFDSGYTLRHGF